MADALDTSGFDEPGVSDQSVLDLIMKKPEPSKEGVTPVRPAPKQESQPVKTETPTTKEEPASKDDDKGDDNFEYDPFGDIEADSGKDDNPDGAGDEDDPEFDVTVDGQVTKVKLKELKSKYSLEKATEVRLQAAAEARSKAEKQSVELSTGLAQQFEKLKTLDQILQAYAEPQINWEELKEKNPAQYLIERDKQREAKERRELVWAEGREVERKQRELNETNLRNLVAAESEIFRQKTPELADKKRGPALLKGMSEAAVHYGYTPQELEGVADHRPLLVLADAAKWRAAVARAKAKKQNTTPVNPRPLTRPGASNTANTNNQNQKQAAAIKQKAQETGDPDDIAKFLLVKRK